MARRAAEKAAALRQGLTAGDGEARRTGALWWTDAWRQRAAASAAAASVARTWPSSAPWLRFELDPWRRVCGKQDLQTAACGGGDGAVGLSFKTHHGGSVAPSPEFAACAASSCSAELMVLLVLQRGELLVHHDRPSHHHRRRFPTLQPAEAAAAVEVGWGFQVLRLRAFPSF
uniref:Uncharacterized protein n=1 Tax=Oryza meridionalis TaxID=40149 RepID=A0A0E0ELF7_9ORYZ